MITRETMPQGICPACGKTVAHDEDAIWTCRYNLNTTNAYWEASPLDDDQIARLETEGYYGLCLSDAGLGYCEESHMPLHAACYEEGNY